MSLRIYKGGVLDSIQDAGRFGYRHLGINPTGAMDRYAMQIANILVGNEPNEPVIEMHFPVASFFFEHPAMIAISGADFLPTINAEKVPILQPILINKFGILQFEGIKKGARAYLAIKGGLKINPWLNSCSTNLKAMSGGFEGRGLQKDDEIGFHLLEERFINKLEKQEFIILPWKADNRFNEAEEKEILVLPGNEWDWLTHESKNKFEQQPFEITINSDRMGYRLHAGALKAAINEEVVSSAVTMGTVQLLPDGKLILLMADHQTTGGYPRLAHAITAHHPRLAQMKTGDKIYFRFCDQQTAEELLIKQQQHLQQLQYACTLKLQDYATTHH